MVVNKFVFLFTVVNSNFVRSFIICFFFCGTLETSNVTQKNYQNINMARSKSKLKVRSESNF